MYLEAVSLQTAAKNLGLMRGETAEISRRGLADALRTLIEMRGSAPLATATTWARRMVAAVEAEEAKTEREINAVVDALVLVGDLGIASAYGTRILLSQPQSFVALPDGRTAVLGSAYLHEPVASPANDELTRFVTRQSGLEPTPLMNELEPPTFLAALRQMEYPVTSATGLHHLRAALPELLSHQFIETDTSSVEEGLPTASASSILAGYVDEKPAIYKVSTDGLVQYRVVPNEDFLDWCNLALTRKYIDAAGKLDNGLRLPTQLARAFLICGTCNTDNASWDVNQETAAYLNEWLGAEEADTFPFESGFSPDPDQRIVVEAQPSARLIVEAGPGSGKTWVACERVAYLIRNDVAAPRIWLLSFTLAAVEEIRQRIGESLGQGQAVAGVNISTFDSLAGRLRVSFQDDTHEAPTSYEGSIRAAIRLLKSDNLAVKDFLGQIEHVIVDEAQDLVGARKLLVLELLAQVRKHCGITIFADPAQSIYGYQERSLTGRLGKPFFHLLRTESELAFSEAKLGTDHRTKKESLRDLFVEARGALGNQQLSNLQKYDTVRDLIERSADRVLPPDWDRVSASSGNTMMLFRSHRDALVAANRLWGRSALIRFRITGRDSIIAPWVGAALGRLSGSDQFGRQDFSAMWREVWPPIAAPTEEEAWETLRRAGGVGASMVSITSLCDRLEQSVPRELASNLIGDRGPVLGTIHGAKGREAEQVVLMLPRRPREESDVDWAEEARVLFVGATRAKKSLRVGPGGQYLKQLRHNKRFWGFGSADERGKNLIEIGRDGDVLEHENFCVRMGLGEAQQLEHLRRVWGLSGRTIPAKASLVTADGNYAVIPDLPGEKNAEPIAFLSEAFGNDLRSVAGGHGYEYPSEIGGFWVGGIRTVLAGPSSHSNTEESATGIRRLALAPVICGLATVERQ